MTNDDQNEHPKHNFKYVMIYGFNLFGSFSCFDSRLKIMTKNDDRQNKK
jgi:hypothetical protein